MNCLLKGVLILSVGVQLALVSAMGQSTKPARASRRARAELPALTAPKLSATNSGRTYTSMETVSSEFFYQLEASKWELTPQLEYGLFTVNYKNLDAPKSSDSTAFRSSVKAEYGINQMLTGGLALGYPTIKTSFSPPSPNDATTRGLEDPNFYLLGRLPLTAGTLHFGGELRIAIDKSRTGSDNSSNAASGGHTLTPYIGYDRNINKGVLGAKFAYDFYKGDRSNETLTPGGTAQRSTTKGGETLQASLFYELPIDTFIAGASLTYSESAKTKTLSGTNGTSTQDDNVVRAYIWKVYGAIAAAPNVTLLPSASYGVQSLPGQAYAQNVDNMSGWSLGLGARINM